MNLTNYTHTEILLNLKDCREAAAAARSMGDITGENKYMDQMAPYLMELQSRKVIGKIENEA